MFKWVSHRSFFVIMACGETQGYEYQHLSGYRVIYIQNTFFVFEKITLLTNTNTTIY